MQSYIRTEALIALGSPQWERNVYARSLHQEANKREAPSDGDLGDGRKRDGRLGKGGGGGVSTLQSCLIRHRAVWDPRGDGIAVAVGR